MKKLGPVFAYAALFILTFCLVARPQPTTERDLKLWYDGYNENYFLNQLPANTIVYYDDTLAARCGETFKLNGVFRIRISRKMNPTEASVQITLLHEMAHVATWDAKELDHGPKFMAVMRRLMSVGAFDGLL